MTDRDASKGRLRTSAAKAGGKPSDSASPPKLLSGGNPQIAKGYGDAPVEAYIAAMPGWKSGQIPRTTAAPNWIEAGLIFCHAAVRSISSCRGSIFSKSLAIASNAVSISYRSCKLSQN